MAITNKSTLTSKYSLPDGGEEQVTTYSNETSTPNTSTDVTYSLTSTKNYVAPGGKIEYQLTITNNMSVAMTDVEITDTLSADASFDDGSVTVGGVSQSTFDPTTGFTLPDDISANDSVVITYTATVDSTPTGSDITNTCVVDYKAENLEFTGTTNTLDVPIKTNTIVIEKSASPAVVTAGDKITFTNVIKNEGTYENSDLVFTDSIPASTTFVENSVTIDGNAQAGANPNDGINLPNLAPNATTTIVFEVTVNSD